MADKIIVIEKVEDDNYQGKGFKKVTDKAGETWKIKSGREDSLKNKWHLLVPGKAIKLTMGEYQGHPFVQNFEVVEDLFVEQAATKVQEQQKTDTDNTKAQTMFASYVKDAWLGGKLPTDHPLVVRLLELAGEKMGVKPITPEKLSPVSVKPPEPPPEASIAPSSSGRTAGFEPAKSGSSPGGATKPFDSKEFIATAAILADRGMEKWKYDKILERLNKLSGLNHRTVAGGMMKLNEEQRNSLVSELNEDFSKAQ